MEIHLRVVSRIYEALMFMSPHYKIKEFRKEVLREIARFSICVAADF